MKSKLLQFFNALPVLGIFLVKEKKVQHVFSGIGCCSTGNLTAFACKLHMTPLLIQLCLANSKGCG